ncbi:hypothetical protein HGRIS_002851 [Hohenbuehelia grisea]|uniref:Uncharacterized protein n=1 Tax=Hohenbuehelia grisea TaxID=104357 RepID=A0ABR3JLW8_9AGAR
MKLSITFCLLAQTITLARAASAGDLVVKAYKKEHDPQDLGNAKDVSIAPGINSRIAKRAACDNAQYIDVFFDVNLDGDRFAQCLNVPINNWAQSSTPGDFNWCRKELLRCSQANASNASGVCNRATSFCAAAQNYCTTLGGDFYCMG